MLTYEQAKAFLENPEAFAVAAAPAADEPGAAGGAAEAKEEEKPAAEEESDDDMVRRWRLLGRMVLIRNCRALACLTRIHVLVSCCNAIDWSVCRIWMSGTDRTEPCCVTAEDRRPQSSSSSGQTRLARL